MNDLTEYVVRQAEAIEKMPSADNLDYLDAKVVAGVDGTVREVILITTTGGPHVEVNATDGTVTGYWGGDRHTTHCDSLVLDEIDRRIREQFNAR